jgi:hypothetical protein
VKEITVEVQQVRSVTSYAHPQPLRTREKAWHGEICVVSNRVVRTLTEWSTGATEQTTTPLVETALLREGDRWFIVSEHTVKEARNVRAAELANDLNATLKRVPIEKIKLWSGLMESFLYDRLRSSLAAPGKSPRITWRTTGVTMAGQKSDAPQISGAVTVHGAGEKRDAHSTYKVTLSFVLDANRDRLRLVKITFAPGDDTPR